MADKKPKKEKTEKKPKKAKKKKEKRKGPPQNTTKGDSDDKILPPPQGDPNVVTGIRVRFEYPRYGKTGKKLLIGLGITLLCLVIFAIIFAFVIFPFIFKASKDLQRFFIFAQHVTTGDKNEFKSYESKLGLRNLYVAVEDGKKQLSLGVWHIIPNILKGAARKDKSFDFEYALNKSNLSVMLFFHGNAQNRSAYLEKYDIMAFLFHVVTFDYRSFGDSTEGELDEKLIVNDCVQLYEWLAKSTQSPIFLWGHSLGASLAASTAEELKSRNVSQPVGLILESPFTALDDLAGIHHIGKFFKWLPYFKATIRDPLKKNGFIFNTTKSLMETKYPIMIFHAVDDIVVPVSLGRKLYNKTKTRKSSNVTLYYEFPEINKKHDHYFVHEDPFIKHFLE